MSTIRMLESGAEITTGIQIPDPIQKLIIFIITIIVIRVIAEIVELYAASKKLKKAEEEAYAQTKASTDDPNKESNPEKTQPLLIANLFHLYEVQIGKYQQATQRRASWSFFWAIVSMCVALLFIFWGGFSILTSDAETKEVTAGAAITAIGGGISAYITKTFLDVHKLSLTQLNRYFKQPAINYNIIMAQRLADEVKDDEVRKEAYKNIINSITLLINEDKDTEARKEIASPDVSHNRS